MKIAIIGGGISGLSIANLLNDEHEVYVFEKDKSPGGLIKCERVNDCLFHKVGGHVFNSKNNEVFDWFWSHFDKEREFVEAKRNAKVFFDGQIVGYPIENYLYLLNPDDTTKIIDDLLRLHKLEPKAPFDYTNFEEFLLGTFGETFYNLYFKPYNQKIWRTDLKDVAMPWLEGKLPMPKLDEIIKSNILRQEEQNMVHSSFFYAKENGSQFIIDRLKENINVITNTTISNITEKNGKLMVDESVFDTVIYCGDIRMLPQQCLELLARNGIDLEYLKNLRSNGTSNLFCETDENNISWLYIPQDFTRAHRIIYTGNFSESNNRGSNRKTCVVEFSGKLSFEEMCEEIKTLPGNLKPLAQNYETNSYVIQDTYTREFITNVKSILKKHNIYLLGRFAEWEYYNMDKAIEAAFELKKLINK